MKDVVIEDTHADVVDGVLVQVSQFLADMTGLIKKHRHLSIQCILLLRKLASEVLTVGRNNDTSGLNMLHRFPKAWEMLRELLNKCMKSINLVPTVFSLRRAMVNYVIKMW